MLAPLAPPHSIDCFFVLFYNITATFPTIVLGAMFSWYCGGLTADATDLGIDNSSVNKLRDYMDKICETVSEMDRNPMPKSSKSITTNYNAKGRANHEHSSFHKGQNSISNAVLLLQNRIRKVWHRSSVSNQHGTKRVPK